MADVPTPLEDVTDVAAFAAWRVRKSLGQNGHLTKAQLDEAQGEAVVLIYELHGVWDPERCERFSAYLLSYLDRRLISWWRRELRQSGRGSWNGETASYRYFGTVSLDSTAEDFADAGDTALVGYGPGD